MEKVLGVTPAGAFEGEGAGGARLEPPLWHAPSIKAGKSARSVTADLMGGMWAVPCLRLHIASQILEVMSFPDHCLDHELAHGPGYSSCPAFARQGKMTGASAACNLRPHEAI